MNERQGIIAVIASRLHAVGKSIPDSVKAAIEIVDHVLHATADGTAKLAAVVDDVAEHVGIELHRSGAAPVVSADPNDREPAAPITSGDDGVNESMRNLGQGHPKSATDGAPLAPVGG